MASTGSRHVRVGVAGSGVGDDHEPNPKTSSNVEVKLVDGEQEQMDGEQAAIPGELAVGEVAKRSGVAVSTLHFYEAEGLISSRRTAGNQRRYPRQVLRRIAFIRASQGVGIPLRRIKAALDQLPDRRTPTRRDWERLSEDWRSELDDQIDRLQRLRDNLSGCIGCGCLSLDRCKLVNPDDILGRQGPGPRKL
jgi:MerR family redox-sensitive transcriptional activator SoxR